MPSFRRQSKYSSQGLHGNSVFENHAFWYKGETMSSLEKDEINSFVQAELDAYLSRPLNGRNADFIYVQPENPDPKESVSVVTRELTEDEISESLRRTRLQIWGE